MDEGKYLKGYEPNSKPRFAMIPGALYRRKSDGAKLMALEPDDDGWWFHRFDPERIPAQEHYVDKEIEPWTDPPKLVPHWPTLCRLGDDGAYFIGSDFRAEGSELNAYEIRLLTEYPPILLTPKA